MFSIRQLTIFGNEVKWIMINIMTVLSPFVNIEKNCHVHIRAILGVWGGEVSKFWS